MEVGKSVGSGTTGVSGGALEYMVPIFMKAIASFAAVVVLVADVRKSLVCCPLFVGSFHKSFPLVKGAVEEGLFNEFPLNEIECVIGPTGFL